MFVRRLWRKLRYGGKSRLYVTYEAPPNPFGGYRSKPDVDWDPQERAKERSKLIYQELLQKALHPRRVGKHLQYKGDDFTI